MPSARSNLDGRLFLPADLLMMFIWSESSLLWKGREARSCHKRAVCLRRAASRALARRIARVLGPLPKYERRLRQKRTPGRAHNTHAGWRDSLHVWNCCSLPPATCPHDCTRISGMSRPANKYSKCVRLTFFPTRGKRRTLPPFCSTAPVGCASRSTLSRASDRLQEEAICIRHPSSRVGFGRQKAPMIKRTKDKYKSPTEWRTAEPNTLPFTFA